MTRDLIAADVKRCHGNESPDCTGCLRRLQAEIDHEGTDSPWSPWVEPAADVTGCVNLLRGRNQ